MAEQSVYEFYDTSPRKFSDKRNELLLGPLPDDFLRLPIQEATSISHSSYSENNQNSFSNSTPLTAGYPTPNVYPYPRAHPIANSYSYPAPLTARQERFLDVTIIEAVLNKSYAITKMDPYCSLRVGHNVFETNSHVGGGKRPRWNKTFHCPLEQGVDCIHIQIFDEHVFNNDSRIAWCLVEIPQEVLQGHSLTDTFPLSGKLGDNVEGHIKLVLSYTVRDVPQFMNYPVPQAMPYYNPVVYPPYVPPYNAHYQYYLPAPMHATQPSAQQPQPQQVRPISDADIAALQEMFPEKTCDEIKSALQQSSGHTEGAINVLLQK